MSGGQGVSFSGGLADGVWTIEMVRKLASDQPGDVSMSQDNWYNIGSVSRFTTITPAAASTMSPSDSNWDSTTRMPRSTQSGSNRIRL
jgi:hypothetical protein